jgi:hypothetical protein
MFFSESDNYIEALDNEVIGIEDDGDYWLHFETTEKYFIEEEGIDDDYFE